MSARRSIVDELGDLMLRYGAIVRLRAAIDLLATRADAEAARRKLDRMEERHHAARRRFEARWSKGNGR